jgi:hypothetical protein
MQRRLLDIFTGVLAVVALVAGALTIRRELSATPERIQRASIEKDWEEFAGTGLVYGDSLAGVTIVEFAD